MTFPYGCTITVERPPNPSSDRYGNRIKGATHTVEGCTTAPAGSVEIVNGQQTVIDHDTVYGPYMADVEPNDLVTIPAGQPIPQGVYEVQGQPANYRNPWTGWQPGCVIRLERVTG